MSKPLRVACILEQADYKPGDQAPEDWKHILSAAQKKHHESPAY